MKDKNQNRQGDVWIEKVNHTISKDAKKLNRDAGRIVLAYGEVTGHAHAIKSNNAELFEEADGQWYLSVNGVVTVEHEEHGAIELTTGTYLVGVQRQYTPQAIRRVED